MNNKKVSFGYWMLVTLGSFITMAFVDEIFLGHTIRTAVRGVF